MWILKSHTNVRDTDTVMITKIRGKKKVLNIQNANTFKAL